MMFIVATNVIASQPPEHRPTGTLTAHANMYGVCVCSVLYEVSPSVFGNGNILSLPFCISLVATDNENMQFKCGLVKFFDFAKLSTGCLKKSAS